MLVMMVKNALRASIRVFQQEIKVAYLFPRTFREA